MAAKIERCLPVAGFTLAVLGLVRVSAYIAAALGHGTVLLQLSARYLDWLAAILALAASTAAVVARSRDRGGWGRRANSLRGGSLLKGGIAIYLALSFWGIEAGKWTHDAQMRQFFVQSGYSPAFMYFVSAAETAAAAALLVPRSRFYGTLMLTSILTGAVATHWRNGDPLGDSRDAFILLAVCASLFAVELVQGGRIRSRPQDRDLAPPT